MLDVARDIIGSQPILTAFLAIGVGYLVGQINLGGFSLGVGAVLFVGLALGAFAPKAQIIGPIGLIGLVWGIVMLLQWLQGLEYIRYAGSAMLVGLVMILVVVALSLILAMPVLRSLFGANNFTTKLAEFSGKLVPYKVGLGFACLVLAIYLLTTLSSMRAF